MEVATTRGVAATMEVEVVTTEVATREATEVATMGVLLGGDGENIKKRMDALFLAKHVGSEEAVRLLLEGLKRNKSVLLRHEIAYVLGQMSWPELCLPTLRDLVDDKDEHPMVRHEAGEAIAALGDYTDATMDVLRRNKNDGDQAVRETIELALEGLARKAARKEREEQESKSGGGVLYHSRDPAVGLLRQSDRSKSDPSVLRGILLNESETLMKRYEAIFSLRNLTTLESAEVLAEGLCGYGSPLFRHEICFVIGQMRLVSAKIVASLDQRLQDVNENAMVRHEAALAMGSVGVGGTQDMKSIIEDSLTLFAKDADPIVSESCEVGLANLKDE